MEHSQFRISIGSHFKITSPRQSSYFPKSLPYGRSRTMQDLQKCSIANTTTTIHEKRNLKQQIRYCSHFIIQTIPSSTFQTNKLQGHSAMPSQCSVLSPKGAGKTGSNRLNSSHLRQCQRPSKNACRSPRSWETIRRCQAIYLRNCAPPCIKIAPNLNRKFEREMEPGEATSRAVLMIVEKGVQVESVAFPAPTQSFSSTAERRCLILATTRASTGTRLEHGCPCPLLRPPSTPGGQTPGPVLRAMAAHSAWLSIAVLLQKPMSVQCEMFTGRWFW